MRTLLPIAVLLSFAACDGASAGPNDGPLALGIVSGNHQTATAGADRLSDPVVGKLVRTPGGGLAFHLVTTAYAQTGTTVSGSPVPGAVVCAVGVTDAALTPFTPCTNTDSNGQATFFFSPGTKAGEAKSEIRGTVENQPAVFDTVTAEVVAGPVADNRMWSAVANVGNGLPLWFEPGLFEDAYANEIDYTVTTGGAFTVVTDAGNGTRGIQPAPGAVVGDTATITFAHDGATLLSGVLTLTPGQVATTWGVTFTAQ